MKNGYDHHDHKGICTYNLSVPKRFILDVPNQSPPYHRYAIFKCLLSNKANVDANSDASSCASDEHVLF